MTKGVFETWSNGGLQKSSLYLASVEGQEYVDEWIKGHYSSGSFANLHCFDSEDEAQYAYNKIPAL
jgi:hypothetical protein